MYDFAHPIQDAIEGITHSLCSLEYEIHRPLYNWVIENTSVPCKPRQIEFARLNLTNTVMSKRFLRYMVENDLVDGWDDPRMPTLCGLRRRGYTAASILDFCSRAGVSKSNSLIELEMLEHCIREELNGTAQRRIAIKSPIRVVIDNYPEDKEETFELPNNPTVEDAGTRPVRFTKEIFIDADDFAEVPPPKFFRLKPGGEVRLMGAYIIKCTGVEKNDDGSVKLIHAEADLETGNGNPTDGRKIKGTVHWLSAKYADKATLMLYDKLFTEANMNEISSSEYVNYLNPESLVRLDDAVVEPCLKDAAPGEKFQFVRLGYFCKDTKLENAFNRVVGLKDSFPKK